MERVIHSFQIIETDDGYRIEIKGDKKRLKKVLRGFRRPFGKKGPFSHSWAFGPMHFAWGMWYGPWEEEEGEAEEGED